MNRAGHKIFYFCSTPHALFSAPLLAMPPPAHHTNDVAPMKVVGFTIIKNAILYDYPVVEAIQSVLPLCDDFVVSVGKSDDATLELIRGLGNPKIRIMETEWDLSKREGGEVLALETNKVINEMGKAFDWAFYIQADEVLHEQHIDAVREAMLQHRHHSLVDGLLFRYLHFYGSYDYIGTSSRWYSREIRVFKPGRGVYSFRDAQGFRKANNEMLWVKEIDACIHHYGWVKAPEAMQEKQLNFNKLWHNDQWIEKHVGHAREFDYSNVDSLVRFTGTHPKVMQPRINAMNWTFDFDVSFSRLKPKDRVKGLLKRWFGWDLNYRNYKVLP